MALEPAGPINAADAIARLLLMPSTDTGLAQDLRSDSYLEALADKPHFSIVAARLAFLADRTDLNPHFAPEPPELAVLALQVAHPYRLQLARVAALLATGEEAPAMPPSEDALAKVEQALARFGAPRDLAIGPHGLDPERGRALAETRQGILRRIAERRAARQPSSEEMRA